MNMIVSEMRATIVAQGGSGTLALFEDRARMLTSGIGEDVVRVARRAVGDV